MAKRRKGKVPRHLKRYLFKKKHKSRKRKTAGKTARRRHVAKRTKHRKSPTRRVTRRKGGRRRRGGGGGTGYGLMPAREDLKLMGASAVIGFLETKAKADANFFLNKVPKPVNQLGYTGNLALVLYVGSHFFKNKWARLGARAAANIASYHIGRMGKPFSSGAEFFSVSGWTDDDVAQAIQNNLGALGALQSDGGDFPGVMSYDDAVGDYGG